MINIMTGLNLSRDEIRPNPCIIQFSQNKKVYAIVASQTVMQPLCYSYELMLVQNIREATLW